MYARSLVAAAAFLALSSPAWAQGSMSVSGNLTVNISPMTLTMVLNPSAATEPCAVPGGTLVSQATTLGGNGQPVTFSMTGNTTDFSINSTTGAVNIVPGGVASADCGQTYNNVVTATQAAPPPATSSLRPQMPAITSPLLRRFPLQQPTRP